MTTVEGKSVILMMLEGEERGTGEKEGRESMEQIVMRIRFWVK